MMKKIVNFLKQLRRGNFDYVFDSISWRLPDWLFYYNQSFLVATDDANLNIKNQQEYQIYFVNEQNSGILEKYGHTKELIKSRLASGDKVVIVSEDDEIVTLVWACSGKRFHKLPGTIIDPGRSGAYYYGIYTREDQRRKGLASMAQNEIYNSYLAEGRYRAYMTINTLNKKSLSMTVKRMNCSIVGNTIYIVLFGIGVCFYKIWPHSTRKVHIFFRKPPNNLLSV